jgi:hypothetical protein
MDETPVVTLYRYQFYVRVQGGVNPQPMFMVVSAQPANSDEVRNAVEQVRGQLAQQPGIGLVPRPAYYTCEELHALPKAPDDAKPGIALVVPQNGKG